MLGQTASVCAVAYMAVSSVVIVLAVGNTLGAFIKGITGFGSAIINLCVWIGATCAGINAGTLQQAVLTECIASEVVAIPLLLLTRAHATCDWALMLSLSIFGAVGAPVGAAMLTHLPPRQVEFAVGCLMLVVILLNCRQKITNAPQQPQTLTCTHAPGADPALPRNAAEQVDSQTAGHWALVLPSSQTQVAMHDVELALVAACPAVGVAAAQLSSPASAYSPTPLVVQDAAGALVPQGRTVHRTCSSSSSSSRCSSTGSLTSDAQCVCVIDGPEELWGASHTDQEQDALLSHADTGKHAASDPATMKATSLSANCREPGQSASCSTCSQGTCITQLCMLSGWWSSVTQPDSLAALRRILLMGSLAGSASGVMAGLTGMGGPPVMLMFEKLQVPKDTVRGTNAVCNVFQMRIFAYIVMGVFTRSDINLYIIVSAGAIVGMLLGCLAASHTNQAMFSRMLTTLMVLCCLLMFASAAGIAGGNSSEHSSQ